MAKGISSFDIDEEAPPLKVDDEKDERGAPDDTQKNASADDAQPPISVRKLLSLAKPEFSMLFVAFLLMLVAEGSGLLNPMLLANAYDTLIDPQFPSGSAKMTEINRTMILVMLVHITSVACGFFRSAIMGVAGERIVARLRNRLYSSILKQEIAFFDENKTGDLVSRLGSDTTLIQQATSLAIPEVMVGIAKLIAATSLMFWISPQLASVTLGVTLLLFIVCIPFGKALGKLSKAYQEVLGEAQTRSTEALGGMRTVQSFAAEDRERNRYQDVIGDPDLFPYWWPIKSHKTTYKVGFHKSLLATSFFTFIFGFGFGAMLVSLWYGFKLVVDEQITLGDLTAFQSYIFQIGSALGQTSRFISQVIEAKGASSRIFNLLDRVPAIPSPKKLTSSKSTVHGSGEDSSSDERGDGVGNSMLSSMNNSMMKPSSMTGAVELRNVYFSYPSRTDVPVLRDFCLTIPPNTTAALVGSSGGGKSTVVALLQRFYEIDSGSILIDGNNIHDLDLAWMRRNIGCVQQEPQLFGLTVRQNVYYGLDRQATDDEIVTVCKEANCHDFIMKWPEGYDTLVGERGVKLSGGQKQRIAIARALLVNPRILLLDEATSALDAESEHLVQEAIDNAMVGRTVIIVAHRLSTIMRADQIVVMDEHKIEDIGTHDVLMGRCSKYQDLLKRQSVINKGLKPSDLELNE
eukprot:scaffold18060_cov55-Attheya_sp.AAC.3